MHRSKLVSLLAFPVIEQLPITFDELAYSSYDVGFMKHGDSAYNTLAASTDPVYVKLIKVSLIIKKFTVAGEFFLGNFVLNICIIIYYMTKLF